MPSIEDVDEYEKGFMIKFVKSSTEKKIKEIEKRIEECEDSFKRLELKRQIRNIQQKADKEIEELTNEKPIEKLDLGVKNNLLGITDSEDFYEFNNVKIPMNIWKYLFEYQRDGVKWLISLFSRNKGGVLADEMGLGKTIQVATFVVSLIFSKLGENFLILAPVTVIEQWVQQFKELNSNLKVYKELSIKKKGIFIVSYESFRSNNILSNFDCVFLDEGHKIKNKDAQITTSVKRIASMLRFIITGTPIQNNLGELWSIFDFVNPGLLGSYVTFQDEFENKIKNNKTESAKQQSYYYSVMLRSMIEPFILRRTKSMIQHNLPCKIDKVIFINLTEKQENLYCSTLDSKRFMNCAINGFTKSCSFLTAITYIRKICNHPLLIKNASFDTFKCEDKEIKDPKTLLYDRYNNSYEEMVLDAAKLKVTFEMLDKWFEESNKVLIFFQSVQMLEIMAESLTKFRKNYNFFVLMGSTALSQRSVLIESFNSDKNIFIFLLTTRVGGLGINLTGANRVIIYDPDWNPASDNQAKERIYRYGQKSSVEIYRLITRGTIEEKIYQKQIYKDCLSKKILLNPETVFEKEYFFDLFSKPTVFDSENTMEDNKMAEEPKDSLINVNQEDTKSFLIMKELNSKKFLSGSELIEYIKRRESSLTE